jgi:type IV pilus assembly protein PilB
MAKLDIAEKRLPQDGRIRIKMTVGERSRDVGFRVSTAPTRWGEKIVMRLLDKSGLVLHMAKLGLEPFSLERFKSSLARLSGMVLVTGPTGSGKTNTLYAAIAALNGPQTNVMTAEDRIDYSLPGVNQVPIRRDIGLDAAAALRTLLRQDPDVIVVDEIRDNETAEFAVKVAARPGCLMLVAMNDTDTTSVVEALTRASGQPFLLGRGLSLVVAQRLVRRICTECRVDVTGEVPSSTLIEMGIPPDAADSHPVFKGKGCRSCNGTGYKGRVGLFEVMEVSENIRALVKSTAEPERLRRQAMEEGMLTLRMSGLLKIKEGVTTVEEVLRHTDL